MAALDEYRRALQDLDDPEPFLLEGSSLPGPRANIELAHAMADVGTRKQFDRFLLFTPDRAPVGSREEFLGVLRPVGASSSRVVRGLVDGSESVPEVVLRDIAAEDNAGDA
jgi:hypothetical protein